MNYLAQLKGFRRARLTNPLSANSICLYFILLEYVNEINFLQWFTAPNSTLIGLTGLSLSALKRSRNELIQKGFINYKSGQGSMAGKYHIVDLCVNFEPQCGRQSEPQVSHNPDGNVDPLYKLNETKLNEDNIPPLSLKEENKKGKSSKPKNEKPEPKHKLGEYGHVRLTDKQIEKLKAEFGEETFLAYVKRVDEYCQQKGKTYADYNLTIRNWKRRDDEEAEKKRVQITGASPKTVPKYGHHV